MKLLLDANISRKLIDRLAATFPGSTHVVLIGLESAADQQIWDHAKERDYLIVSKDEDFHQKALVDGPPPKLIWVRLGNCTTSDIEQAIQRGRETIVAFADDRQASFLVIE